MKFRYFLPVLFLFLFSHLFASDMSINEKEVTVEQKVAEFAQTAGWMNLDSYIDYIGTTELKYDSSTSQTELTPSYFSSFEYTPVTDKNLITKDSLKNIVSIASESDVNIEVKYNNLYDVPVSGDYPILYYRKKQSSEPFNQIKLNSKGNDIFATSLSVDYGIYEYYVCADNEYYPGVYTSQICQFVVTERPHDFQNLKPNLQDDKGNPNTNLEFMWNVQPGVEDDVLKYTLFLGTSENSMQEYQTASQNFYVVTNLMPRTRYYWKVETENQYGVKLLSPQIFNFVTLGAVSRVYNAPNPFNPQRGQTTRIFFEMYEDGNAEINIYSEYGDKIRTISVDNLLKGTNEIEYDGKDDYGNILYNGTYLCVLKKNGSSNTEKCRLLIIK